MVLSASISEVIDIPDGVTVNVEDEGSATNVSVKGPNGETSRLFSYPNLNINVSDDGVVVDSQFPKKRDKAMVGTIRSHINNMIIGVTDGFTYKMKIVYAHFPMTVKVQGNEVNIDNFIGERAPRVSKIVGSAKVNVKGDEVTITGVNKEDVGQTMANLEQATKILGKDPRVFQDGIYLVSKE